MASNTPRTQSISPITGEPLSAPDDKKAAEAKASKADSEASTKKKFSLEDYEFNLPSGKVLGSFGSFSIGLLWNVPNIRETDMLTPVPIYEHLEEKVYFSIDLEKDPHFQDPTVVELYKHQHSLDLHIRATNNGDYDEGSEADPMNMLRPEFFVFSAAVVNGAGKTIRQEKLARSYMAKGSRCWEIPSFIPATEFDMDKLLTSSGDLQLRLAFECKKYFPNTTLTESIPASVGVDSTAETVGQSSKSNANLLEEKFEKLGLQDKKTLNHNYFANLTLDGFPARFKHLLNREKFTDGVIHVIPPGEAEGSKRTFPVHRAILASQASGFEKAFECEQELSINKYCIRSVEVLLNYVYSGELICDRRLNVLEDMIGLADEYQVVGLKDRCLNTFMELEETIDGGIARFKAGIKHEKIPLKLDAMKIFQAHKSSLMENPDFQLFVRENELEDLFFPMFV